MLARGDEHTLGYVAPTSVGSSAWPETGSSLALRRRVLETPCRPLRKTSARSPLSIRALVDAHLGRVAETRAATDEGLPLALAVGVVPAHLEMLAIRGFLEYRWARLAKPIVSRPAPRRCRSGVRRAGVFRFHGDAIETLLALGEHDAATALLAELEEQARARARVGAYDREPLPPLLSAAAGDSDAAYASLDRALELHEQLQEPFERAHASRTRDPATPESRERPARER